MLRKEVIINQSVENVWEALTQPEKMKDWYFSISSFEAREGEIYDFIVSFEDEDGVHDFRHLFKILEVILNKKLKHTWEYPSNSKGISTLSWELIPEGDSTKVILTHEGLENVTEEGSKYFSIDSFEQGWNDILNIMKEHLDRKK